MTDRYIKYATEKYVDDNAIAKDYGDTVLLEVSAEDIKEAFRLTRIREENGASPWYVNLRIPQFEIVEDERYLIDFLGKTTLAMGYNDWYPNVYGSDIFTEVDTYVDPDVLDDENWVDEEGVWSLSIDYEMFSFITDDMITPLVIKQVNVKPIEDKYLNQDFVIGYTLSMGRHLSYDIGQHSACLGFDVGASGEASFAQGEYTFATGYCSSAMGCRANSTGPYSHAINDQTTASGYASFAQGIGTHAVGEAQHVFGYYNIYEGNDIKNYLQIVGNGTWQNRSNAYTLDKKGNGWFAGNVTVGADNKELVTKDLVDDIGVGGVNIFPDSKDLMDISYFTTAERLVNNHLGFTTIHLDNRSGDTSTRTTMFGSKNGMTVVPGETYTLSFSAKGTGFVTTMFSGSIVQCTECKSSTGEVNNNAAGLINTQLTNEWKRYWVTYKLTDYDFEYVQRSILFSAYGGNDVYICAPKLERGSKASDWSYSEEDVATKEMIPTKMSQLENDKQYLSVSVLQQSQYDALVQAGQINEDVLYVIID